eukprot:XP_001701351.1 predicted protein [Chlamydomonas reinhardtii]
MPSHEECPLATGNGMSSAVTIGVRCFSNAWNEENWTPASVAAEITAAERSLKQAQERDASSWWEQLEEEALQQEAQDPQHQKCVTGKALPPDAAPAVLETRNKLISSGIPDAQVDAILANFIPSHSSVATKEGIKELRLYLFLLLVLSVTPQSPLGTLVAALWEVVKPWRPIYAHVEQQLAQLWSCINYNDGPEPLDLKDRLRVVMCRSWEGWVPFYQPYCAAGKHPLASGTLSAAPAINGPSSPGAGPSDMLISPQRGEAGGGDGGAAAAATGSTLGGAGRTGGGSPDTRPTGGAALAGLSLGQGSPAGEEAGAGEAAVPSSMCSMATSFCGGCRLAPTMYMNGGTS